MTLSNVVARIFQPLNYDGVTVEAAWAAHQAIMQAMLANHELASDPLWQFFSSETNARFERLLVADQ
jgi:hypothetical protein